MTGEIAKAKDAVKDASVEAKDKLEAAARDAKAEASRAADKIGDRAKDLADDLSDTASSRAREVAEGLRDTAGDVKDRASAQFSAVRDALSDTGARIAETLRATAERADLKSVPENVVHAVSQGVSATATAIRERDVATLAEDLRSAARRHPGTFVLGAAAVGFIVGRFLLASRDEADRRRGGRY